MKRSLRSLICSPMKLGTWHGIGLLLHTSGVSAFCTSGLTALSTSPSAVMVRFLAAASVWLGLMM